MAQDYSLPHQDLIDLVPQQLRNPMLRSLIDNLFNRFLTQDEAVPLFGYVGRKPASLDDHTPKVPQLNIERDINALIPVLSFKVGAETYSFTAQDLIRKAEVLGISSDQSQWLYSQGNNYAPPIDFDKFTNFFNYYWVANALASPPALSWNPSLAPEYYTMAQPKLADLDKLNVRVATTNHIETTGTGYHPQAWMVTFASATTFTVRATGSLLGFAPGEDLQGPFTLPVLGAVPSPGPYPTQTTSIQFVLASASAPMLTFDVVRDVIADNSGGPYSYESFSAGDQFTITAPFLSSTYSVTFNGGAGQKGKLAAINTLDIYQMVDGVLLQENDRVLVQFGASADQGIFIVKPGDWIRAADFNLTTAAAGAKTFVTNGSQAGSLFVSVAAVGGFSWSLLAANAVSNTNDWQEGNLWVKRDNLAALGINPAKVTQATRPIIEFNGNLPLSSSIGSDGKPSDFGVAFKQSKSEFNQAPLFDLYRYDGTHARKASTIFYYSEDPTADIDVALQRRVKHSTNSSADFLFNHGLIEGNSLLFYKDSNGTLHTIWHPGYSQATIVDQEFGGSGNGTLTVSPGADAFSPQQIWALSAISSTQFEVIGSKLKVIPSPYDILTVGVPYFNGLFNATITPGTVPFIAGDVFKFRFGNFETTRYVYRDTDQTLYDSFGGPALDINKVGTWQVPRMFFNNVAADNGAEVPEGTLYSHFRGILGNQLENTSRDNAFGGSIKLWSEQQNLLAALLMQRDMTPISMIDLAQRQYENSLNQVVDIYITNIFDYFSKVEVLNSPADVSELLNWILAIRANDADVRTVLYDTTSPLISFPATLPQLGVTPLVEPGVVFDGELGTELFRHHDGHLSPLFIQSPAFRDRVLGSLDVMTRTDGSTTPVVGSYTTDAPSSPYKGLLWLYPLMGNTELRAFAVVSDKSVAPEISTLEVGDYWYKRSANLIFVWDGVTWQSEPNLLAPWVAVDIAELLNDVLQEVETRLFNGISTEQRTYFSNVATAMTGPIASNLQRELNTWAVSNGFDPTAPDYNSTDAFTWNYSSLPFGSFAPVIGGDMPARWHNALLAHQSSVAGVIPTPRPNLEPYKLMGFGTKPVGWDASWKATVTPADVTSAFTNGGEVRAVSYSVSAITTPLVGLPVIDDILITAGETVLLASEATVSSNGMWIVSSGPWVRSANPLAQNTMVSVSAGVSLAGTTWVLMADVNIVGVDAAQFEQIRSWKHNMWAMIQSAHPTLRLSVDPGRDLLLPPYVSAYLPWAANALTNTMPPAPAKVYLFGESSPVETVWRKSIEYRYSLARALFRHDPLSFLGNCWGFEWVQVDGILYDGYDMSVPGHPRFRLHGQSQPNVARVLPLTVAIITGPNAYSLTIRHDSYTASRKQGFTIRDAANNVIGHVNEGVTSTLTQAGYTISSIRIEDEGKPFRVGDNFIISGNADGSGMSAMFVPAPYHQILGFGQTFAQALRSGSIDTNQGYAIDAYKNWNVNLGYRAGGLVSTDDLRVFTDSGTSVLPESAYALRFKRAPYARDLWAHALRCTVVQLGTSTINQYGNVVPANDGSDWVFRIEGYNSRYLELSYFTYDTAGSYSTFDALSKAHTSRMWKQFTNITGNATIQLPLTITGLQNIVTFLYGYSKKLEADGFRFDDPDAQNIDAETGRARNWQLEIEKIIDRAYAGLALGEGHVANPFIDRIWVDQDTGLLAEYFDTALFDVTAHPAVFDTVGVKIPTHDLTVLRSRGQSRISSTIPMFTVHAQVDEYEHVFVFNNLSSPSTGEGLIYDPFSGARVGTIKLNGRRQGGYNLRPEFGGHYLVGDEVKRNFQASVDTVAQYYDADSVYEDELSTRHALALLGFSPKAYMSDLDLNNRTQFNFWRGLIQMKGTNASINAFLNNDRFEDAKLDEYWAYKVAEYGDSRAKIFPELKLTVDDTLQQFTKLIFDPSIIPTDYAAFTVILADDEARWFSIDDLNGETSFEAQVTGTYSKNVVIDEVVVLPFTADKLAGYIEGVDAIRINGNTIKAIIAGALNIIGYGPSTPKFNPIKLFNFAVAELIEEIPHWHPAVGQHSPVALESVNVISAKDPARYNNSTLVIGNANYDPLRMWGADEVGRVWWDTTNLEYLPYSDTTIFGTVDERLSRWGTLADFASVDIVEWVESIVPPAQYDAQAAIDAGNAELDTRARAEGTVYGAKTYTRERRWAVRPIAWSKSTRALAAAHPSFGSTFGNTMNLVDSFTGLLYLQASTASQPSTATFALRGIVAGMRVGGWIVDESGERPTCEFLVLDAFTKHIIPAVGASVSLVSTAHTGFAGMLVFTPYSTTEPIYDVNGALLYHETSWFVRATESNTHISDVIFIRKDSDISATFTLLATQAFSYFFQAFGLTATLTLGSGAHANSAPATMFDSLDGTLVYDAVKFEAIVPNTNGFLFVNDDTDPMFGMPNVVQWRAWEVPTQAELEVDSRVPNSKWIPYLGKFESINTVNVTTVQDAVAGGMYTLNDGTVADKYQTSWGAWTELTQIIKRAVQVLPAILGVAQPISVQVDAGLTSDRISVYVNGVAQLSGTYSLMSTMLPIVNAPHGLVTITNVPFGHQVVIIVRAYNPSTAELSFNPAIKDNLLVQRQYKVGFQYVELQVRDNNGSISGTKYYFWVKNRTSAAPNNSLSVKAVSQLLTTGPSQYLTFQHMIGAGIGSDPYRYNAIAIAGLNYVVTKDDTFKLRFTRNFTLRDDPQQLDLKDTHAEWSLIRAGQRTKIPETLWNKLVNTACAADVAGNVLPSPRRASYDDRNGTRTRFGFGNDQVLAPTDLVVSTLQFTILNTKLLDESGAVPIPNYMTFLDFGQSDIWFSTPTNTRNTLTRIWNEAKVSQINELFFAVLEDIVASNYELTDIFKTSRLSAYSIKVIRSSQTAPTYE